jgi:hypothetical protein
MMCVYNYTAKYVRLVLTTYENFFHVFLCLLHVGFVPVSNLLDMYSSIWQGVLLSKFLFVTDPKPKIWLESFWRPQISQNISCFGRSKKIYENIAMLLGLSRLGNAAGVV